MGNKKAKKQQRQAQAAAAQQTAANKKIQAKNEKLAREQKRKNLQMENEMKQAKFLSEQKNERTQAAIDAKGAVNDERIAMYKNSNKLLTDFEHQEKQRFLKAKTGTGQVTAEDNAITGEARAEAERKLALGSDYWSNRGQVAYDQAFAKTKAAQDKAAADKAASRRTSRPSVIRDGANATRKAVGKTGKKGSKFTRGQPSPTAQRSNRPTGKKGMGRPSPAAQQTKKKTGKTGQGRR